MLVNSIQVRKSFFLLLLVALSYIVLAKVSIHFATMSEGIAVIWFPNGLLLALFLLRPRKEWIFYALAIIPAEIIADLPSFTLLQALQFAFINLGETLLSALLIRTFTATQSNFQNIRYVLFFIAIALSIVPSLSALLGALVYHTQIESQNDYIAFWRIWFFGDALGILLLTPLIVSWFEFRANYTMTKGKLLEIFITNSLTLLLAFFLFSHSFNASVLPATPIIFILLLIWIVYRQGLHVGFGVGVLIGLIAVYFTVQGKGPFALFAAVENTLYLQEFIAAMMTSTLFFGVLLHQLNEKNALLLRANNELEALTRTLEQKVIDKTYALQEANEALSKLATKDGLTHIFNRRYLEENAQREILKATRHHHAFSLIIFDIDFFKNVNDTYGHKAGDDILISLTQLVKTRLRQDDIFARFGGEEFVIVLPLTTLEKAMKVAEDVRQSVASLVTHSDDYRLRCTISLGVSTLSKAIQTFESLLGDADAKLYRAKEMGRNLVV